MLKNMLTIPSKIFVKFFYNYYFILFFSYYSHGMMLYITGT